jgi:hypothetical protein
MKRIGEKYAAGLALVFFVVFSFSVARAQQGQADMILHG